MNRRVPPGLVIAAVYSALAFLLTISVWSAPSTRYIGEGPDPIQAMWGIGWVPYAVGHGLNPLVSTYMNRPTGLNLLWADAYALPIGAVLGPMTLTLGAMVTYNLVVTLSLALSAFVAYLVIRRWAPGVVAAALGGLLYGFSPYMTAQYIGHLSLVLSAVTPPLALMLVDEIVVRQRRRPVTLAAFAAALAIGQFFISQEVLLTEVIAAAVVIVVLAIAYPRRVRAHVPFIARTLGLAAVAAVAVLAYPTWLQFFGPGHTIISGPVRGTDTFVTDVANFVVPTVTQLMAPQGAISISSHFSGNASEWNAYLGVPLVILFVVATVRLWQVPAIRTTGIVAAIIAVFSLGPHAHLAGHEIAAVPLPWWIPAHLPLLQNILPSRLMIYVFLAAGIMFAFVLRALWLVRSTLVLNMVVALAVLLPLVPTLPAPATTVETRAPFTSATAAAALNGATILFEPLPGLEYPQAMVWQRTANYAFTMIGGYVIGPYAPGVQAFQQTVHDLSAQPATTALSSSQQLALLSTLHALGVTTVIVDPTVVEPGTRALFTQLFDTPGVAEYGFLVWQVTPG